MQRLVGLVILGLFVTILVIPSLVVRGCDWDPPEVQIREEKDTMVKVQFADGRVESLPLQEYLLGVLAAEMPAAFHSEALKAQVVAARTYTLKKVMAAEENKEHPEADLCTDPNHCQAWMSVEDMKKRWGFLNFPKYYHKLERAVEDTRGLVLVYDGQLIDPVYHSTCGGRTENAKDVWNFDIPYLQSVECSWDQHSPRYKNEQRLSALDFSQRLELETVAVQAGQGLIEVLSNTDSGRVQKVRVGNQQFSGTEFRQKLGLTSTVFNWQIQGNDLVFSTRGNGHGVGLCQYGADGMAKEGRDFSQILQHYYTGVEIRNALPE